MILANASLDVALHDTTVYLSILFYPPKNSKYNKISNDEYIKMFWVGLMDGHGSIQVNHDHKNSLQYRLIIKLKYVPSNYKMLIRIAQVLGGYVTVTNKASDVIWVANGKETIKEIIKIYDTYPPLTSSLICQLDFLRKCLEKFYLSSRDYKYLGVENIVQTNLDAPRLPIYFQSWLSGFIEAEGCFSRRKIGTKFFSIGKIKDIYIITAIQQFFGINNKIRLTKEKYYFLEVYNKATLNTINAHFCNYPLGGAKAESLLRFNEVK